MNRLLAFLLVLLMGIGFWIVITYFTKLFIGGIGGIVSFLTLVVCCGFSGYVFVKLKFD